MAKIFNLTTLLYIALILAMVSSLSHVAFAFSTVNGSNDTEAYISAIAIDLGLLALAAGINSRKRQRRSTWTLWAGVILFSIISTYANWLAGITHVIPLTADVTGVAAWLVSLRPILLSGVLPLLVIYLSEIVSGNYNARQNDTITPAVTIETIPNDTTPTLAAAEPLPIAVLPVSNKPLSPELERAHDAKQSNVLERREIVLKLLQSGMSQVAIANELGVSLPTINRDAAALNGRVKEVA